MLNVSIYWYGRALMHLFTLASVGCESMIYQLTFYAVVMIVQKEGGQVNTFCHPKVAGNIMI
ncbi:hypothetical protein KAM472_35640 [Aeromonas caviae]|nr:hypothetical protein KAM462_34440 [Aeromonas caviae]GKR12299.1 hypothetical protein KAM465_38760 [Aeromonas caviae]GKR16569.1 hypothetical protein KAM466_38870 [Aeromonas caviae]GKR20893.1 hypothetical protein KAM467_39370 [Aeromonas caviae]GKR29032.1 hypothetical protein KAM469_34910 [Aeromonas caviae]